MRIVFKKEYLRELYEDGKAHEKRYRFQPHIIKRYQLRIEALEDAKDVNDLMRLKSLRYETLKGDKAGLCSIRVNDQYRIEFSVEQIESDTVVTICNIWELSNHYK